MGAAVFAGFFVLLLRQMPPGGVSAMEGAGMIALYAALCVFMPFGFKNALLSPVLIVIDEFGIGGRFIGGGYQGANVIPWRDIKGAVLDNDIGELRGWGLAGERRHLLLLKVDNGGGFYRRKAHYRLFGAVMLDFMHLNRKIDFTFDITHPMIEGGEAKTAKPQWILFGANITGESPDEAAVRKDIVALINERAQKT